MFMLPVTDFHFVFGGFAAVAATVGYRLARRSTSGSPKGDSTTKGEKLDEKSLSPKNKAEGDFTSSVKKASNASESGALKRKNAEDDHYRHDTANDTSEPDPTNPTKKRNTTPPPPALGAFPVSSSALKRKAESDGDPDDSEGVASNPRKKRSRPPTPVSEELEILIPPSEDVKAAPPSAVIPLEEDEYVVVSRDDAAPVPPKTALTTPPATPPPTLIASPPIATTKEPVTPTPVRTHTPEPVPTESTKAKPDKEDHLQHVSKILHPTPKPASSDFSFRPSILGPIASPSPRPSTPPSKLAEFKTTPGFSRTRTTTTPMGRTTPKTPSHTTGGFAAFAGSQSPLARVQLSPSPSPFRRPVWSIDPTQSRVKDDDEKTTKPATPAFVREDTEPVEERKETSERAHLTGEEDEDLLSEVKGVRLFVKRGNNPFGGAMVGTLRHLVNRGTQDERLLFRREPLWQPTLNARLTSNLRCIYDANEQVLRVCRLEPTQGPGKAHELVVYALKGKAADADAASRMGNAFKAFAEGVMHSHQLKSGT